MGNSPGKNGPTTPTDRDSDNAAPQRPRQIPTRQPDTSLLPDPQPLNVVCYDPQDPQQPCPICKGMGVIKYDVPPDDKRFGKLFRCPNHPVEVDEQRQRRMRRMSNLDAFEEKTFESFEVTVPGYSAKDQQNLQTALATARNFAQSTSGWLLLTGPYGTGKTHLAAAVGNERLRHGDSVLFLTVPDLLDHLRSTFAPQAEAGYDETFDRVRNTDVLILDDLGVENPSQWAQEKLFQLLNHRYSHQKPTVITTNAELSQLDPRIRSRIQDTEMIRRAAMDAPDYRNTQAKDDDGLQSKLPLYSHMIFKDFDVENNVTRTEHETLLKAANAAYEYAQNPRQWLLLTGKYGTGKTHLAAAIANVRRERDDDVVFLTVPDLLDHLRNTFSPTSDVTFDKLFNQIRNVPLLVLDDMGTESAKPWAQEKLFQILDHRYVAQLPTVITTAKQMNEINPRIANRLIDSRICRMLVLDIRSYAQRQKRRS